MKKIFLLLWFLSEQPLFYFIFNRIFPFYNQCQRYSTITISAAQFTFTFTGSVQQFSIPYGVVDDRIHVDLYGASGGSDGVYGAPGYGARVLTDLQLLSGTVINIYVGGKPSDTFGGWNGGGNAIPGYSASGGGGASDIRINGMGLFNRIVVAGGGGGYYLGGDCGLQKGGNGGGFAGLPGNPSTCPECDDATFASGGGANQTSGGGVGLCSDPVCSCGTAPTRGTLGIGGNAARWGGGGGGGYYGGGGGGYGNNGGGGSSYCSPTYCSSTVFTAGFNQNNHGYISISFTYQPTSQPSLQPSSQPSRQPSRQPSGQPTSQPSRHPSCRPTHFPTSNPSKQPTCAPTIQPTLQPTVDPSSAPRGQPSSQPTQFPTSKPSRQPTSQPSSQPSTGPITIPTIQPTSKPSRLPSSQPSIHPSVVPTRQPTGKPSMHPTSQPTSLPTISPTHQPTVQPSSGPSGCPTAQPINYLTIQPTGKPSLQPASNPSTYPSVLPSSAPSDCPTSLPTDYPTVQPTNHPSVEPSQQPSNHPSSQPTVIPTRTPTAPTPNPTPLPTRIPTQTPTFQPTHPTSHPSCQPSSQPTKQPTSRPTTQPSVGPTSPSGSPSREPSSQPVAKPSIGPSSQPSARPSKQPTSQPSKRPTCRPSSTPSGKPTVEPTNLLSKRPSRHPTLKPTKCPTSQPSSQPTGQPVSEPSNRPTEIPSSKPSVLPSSLPSENPSSLPSSQPSSKPSNEPSGMPSCVPTIPPSLIPSTQPTAVPSNEPTTIPSNQPTVLPSLFPTSQPSDVPSSQPLAIPSSHPTIQPTNNPSNQPTKIPSNQPSSYPTARPSDLPSNQPTSHPFNNPTLQPTVVPSSQPSNKPSKQPITTPSVGPAAYPSSRPSDKPTMQPTSRPSSIPNVGPTGLPTAQPTCHPSVQPSIVPSNQPAVNPSNKPAVSPSTVPTALPSAQPSTFPSIQPISPPSSQPSSQPTVIPTAQPYLFHPGGSLTGRNSVLFWLGETSFSNHSHGGEILGTSYNLFGRNFEHQNIFPSTIALGDSSSHEFVSDISKTEGTGAIYNDITTRSTTVIGDINGDKFLDLLVGYPLTSKCSVYLGNDVDDLLSLPNTVRESFAIVGDPYDGGGFLGWSSTGIGDLNGDGLDEIIVSAIFANTVYVIYGKRKFDQNIVKVNELTTKTGFKVTGSPDDINFGVSLTLLNDFQKSGRRADLAITAQKASAGQNVVYILFGTVLFRNAINVKIEQITNNSSACFKIIAPILSFAGFSVAGVGDINSDGFDDLAIGSVPYNHGKFSVQVTYVVYGRVVGANIINQLDLSKIRPEDGFTITGGGFLVAGVGDVNGDLINDMMISSYYAWKGQSCAYLITSPRNMTYSPSLQPSSHPSQLFIADSPLRNFITNNSSTIPSVAPTIRPSREPNLPPVLDPTFEPSRPVTVTLGTARPSRQPTLRPLSDPTIEPTRLVLTMRTARPTASSNEEKDSYHPTPTPTTRVSIVSHRLRGSSPTVLPTMMPTINTTEYRTIICDKPGMYEGNNETNYKFVITANAGTVGIVGNDDGEANNLYVLYCPTDQVDVTIRSFRSSTDVISVTHLSEGNDFTYASVNEVTYSENGGPLTLLFCSNNKLQVILASHTSFQLDESNFLFVTSTTEERIEQNDRKDTVLTQVQIGVAAAFLLFLIFTIYLAPSTTTVSKEDFQGIIRISEKNSYSEDLSVSPKLSQNDESESLHSSLFSISYDGNESSSLLDDGSDEEDEKDSGDLVSQGSTNSTLLYEHSGVQVDYDVNDCNIIPTENNRNNSNKFENDIAFIQDIMRGHIKPQTEIDPDVFNEFPFRFGSEESDIFTDIDNDPEEFGDSDIGGGKLTEIDLANDISFIQQLLQRKL
jgi:hypothetical protein